MSSTLLHWSLLVANTENGEEEMMTEKELMTKLFIATGATDFLVIFKREFSSKDWGEYFKQNKVAVLYVLDEDGNMYEDETLIRVACHEVAHHMQYHYTEGYVPKKGKEHDKVFKLQFAKILNSYYNGRVPQSTIDFIREEGLLDAGNEKAISRRARKIPSQTTTNKTVV
jgi:hypothetical protein